MFEVQSSFIKNRMTTKSRDRWSAFVREKTSSPYSNTGIGILTDRLQMCTWLGAVRRFTRWRFIEKFLLSGVDRTVFIYIQAAQNTV